MKKRWKILALTAVLSLQMALAQAAGSAVMAEETEQAGQEQQTQEAVGEVSAQADALESASQGNVLAAPSVTGALHVEGTHLMGSNGEQVQLRGASTHGLAWFPQYVNEEWFRQLHDEWKANVVRLAMYTAESGGYCTDGDKEALKVLVKQGVQFATACDMYVIVDWHILSDLNPNVYIDEAKNFFSEMSHEFAGNDNVLYEICNEPNGGTDWPAIKTYAEQVIPVIRQNDEDAVIIVGTPNWSQFVDEAAADPITDQDNIMYTLHYYAATHKEDLRSRMVGAIDAGLPIFVTEYGICDASGNGALDIDQANQWIDTLDQYGVSYVAWNMANKDESSSIFLSSCGKTSGFTVDDLSESGKWLRDMLIAHAPGNAEDANGAGQQADSDDGSRQEADQDAESGQKSAGTNGDAGQNAAYSGNGSNVSDGANASGGTDASGVITFTDGDIEASAVLRGNWEENGAPTYQYDLTIKNKGQADCSSWEIDVPFDGEVKLSSGWNGNYTAQGNTLHITSVDYNGTIPAGSSIRDVGFIVSGARITAGSADGAQGIGDSEEKGADAQAAGDEDSGAADAQDGAGNDGAQESGQEDSQWI